MAIIPHLIARYALALYALAALGVFFYVGTAFRLRRKQDLAMFTMERETAVSQSLRAWLMASLCALLVLGVYGVSNFVAPNLPLDQADATPAIGLLITPTLNPTPMPTLQASAPTAVSGPVPTVGPIATPLARPPDTPTPPPTVEGDQTPAVAACTSAGTQLVHPGNSDQVVGVVEVRGTASLSEFAFYKFEIQWPGSDEWVTVQSFDRPVAGGVLGYWDTSQLDPGTYRFRLVVVDQTYNFPDPCTIIVEVQPPSTGD